MATFLLEVGTEDLPASFVSDALTQWQAKIPTALEEQLLTPESIEFYGTPRRLALVLNGIPGQQPDREEEAKGPSVKAAFKDGKPTKAAEGFARSRGVSVDDFEIRETKKGEFIFVTQKIKGRAATDILSELIPQWILGLEGKRFMRWGDGDLRFPRPVRWLVTLMDDQVLPITLTNGSEICSSDRISQGHRVLHPEPITLKSATGYVEAMTSIYVDVDPEERRKKIVAQVEKAAKSVKGKAIVNPTLLEEVINLVEWPTAVVGKYDEEFLELPSEVAITEMESHQRYFPLKSGDSLLPNFITISNGDPAKADIIAEGNGRVIRARLSDGMFFFNADRTQTLADYLPKLEMVTFEERLGSVRQKVDRIVAVAGAIATQLSLDKAQTKLANRAALLCKADLVSQMVGEFPELQGIMGEKYARNSKEPEAVAVAISEHYLPKGAGDSLPQSLTGQIVGLADRLDTLVSIFSLGMKPTGSSDPFALRRAANAVVSIIWAGGLDLNLTTLLKAITTTFAAERDGVNAAELQQELESFFAQRVRTLLQDDEAIDYDLINAVVGDDDLDYRARVLSNLLDARDRARFLQEIRTNGTLANVYATVNRASKLATKGNLDTTSLDPAGVIDAELFKSPAETALNETLQQLVPQTKAAQAERDYQKLIDGLQKAAPVVAEFFDGENSVMVMDDDVAIRQNRLNLLGLLRNHARVLGDFGAIVKG
ncbi:MAG: glycine--tRNA ligase subunit beta [Leptolyngbyaceae cyanobacterium MAG.088]|nr:glycine--tRNA ligase subunit beta [Leptolyngbyaceae cyanobacterium MAG.088]